eukprot:10847048-Alexandrium_andersonii.AAC.1
MLQQPAAAQSRTNASSLEAFCPRTPVRAPGAPRGWSPPGPELVQERALHLPAHSGAGAGGP